MLVAGLFAGIGGFETAFAEAGFRPVLLAEIDPAANAVLRSRFPDTDVRFDVADVDCIPQGTSVVTAGFPCQNLSMAGDKSGIAGAKSGVVGKMFNLIERSNVPTVVIENVYFMLQLDGGEAMRSLVDRFEHLGYGWGYRVLDTMGFGLPHRRRRVYMIASRDIDPRGVLFADDASLDPISKPTVDRPLGFYWTEGRSGVGFTADGIPPLKVGSGIGIPSAPAVLFPDGAVLTPSLGACERLQGFAEGWTDIGEGNSRSRWRMVGNAVSVPVARWVAERIRFPREPMKFETTPLSPSDRWPVAAWNVGEGRTAVAAGDKPAGMSAPSIETFRDDTWQRLSERALGGFLHRATAGKLRMPDGFLEALRSAPRRNVALSAKT